MLNNLIAWSISAAEYARRPDYVYNLNELQSDWLLLIGLLIITCIWAYLIIRSSQNPFNWFL